MFINYPFSYISVCFTAIFHFLLLHEKICSRIIDCNYKNILIEVKKTSVYTELKLVYNYI